MLLLQMKYITIRGNMRLKITIKAKDSTVIKLPLQYNTGLQGLIYKNLQNNIAEFLHNEGFVFNKRKFKLFTFSRLNGKYKINTSEKTITFFGEVYFYLCTAFDKMSSDLINSLCIKDEFELLGVAIEIIKIEVIPIKEDNNSCICRILSPIAVYSTFLKPDGKKIVHYYMPGDEEHNELITKNLQKKYEACYHEKVGESIKVVSLGKIKRCRVYYKNVPTEGYIGNIKIEGSSKLIKMALETGLGARNSQGFGCILERGKIND